MELSHPGLPEDGRGSHTMSWDTDRHLLSHLGGIAHKKWKSEWKENCISSPPGVTWLFQHIWFVTFADCLVVIKEIRVDEIVQLSPSFPRLRGHPADKRAGTTLSLIVAGSAGKSSRGRDREPSVELRIWALGLRTLYPRQATLPSLPWFPHLQHQNKTNTAPLGCL